jgi:hypothetical protein
MNRPAPTYFDRLFARLVRMYRRAGATCPECLAYSKINAHVRRDAILARSHKGVA